MMTHTTSRRLSAYQASLFACKPLFTTRLVREGSFTYPERQAVCTPADVAAVLQEYFRDKDREEFIVVLLDTGNSMIGLHRAHVGSLNASIVDVKQVFKAAFLANAAAVIVAHQHPSGNPEPSREDIRISKKLVEAGKLLECPVHDSLVITDSGYTSLAERGLI